MYQLYNNIVAKIQQSYPYHTIIIGVKIMTSLLPSLHNALNHNTRTITEQSLYGIDTISFIVISIVVNYLTPHNIEQYKNN